MAGRSLNGRAAVRSRVFGFTYVGVLLAVALVGVGLLAVSEVWVAAARSQRRAQIDWVGEQYVSAIRSYYYSRPGGVPAYPMSVDELLEESRSGMLLRHLRQSYGATLRTWGQWELIKGADGGIYGIRVREADDLSTSPRQYLFVPGRP